MCFFGLKLFSTIGIFILIGIYYFKNQRKRMVKMMEQFEGPPLLPFFGNSLKFLGDPTRAHEVLQRDNIKYFGRPYRLWMLYHPIVVIHHYKDVANAFKIITKHDSYDCFEDIVGQGLITANGEKWKRNRAMIEPAFQTHMLSHHIFYILVKHSNNLVAKLSQHENKELDIWSHVFKTAFNSIHDITMGFDEKLDEETVTKFEQIKCFELLAKRIYSPYLRLSIVFKIFTFLVTGKTDPFSKARSLFDESIGRSKRKYMDRKYCGNTEHEKKKIIMDTLLDAGCSDEVIRDEIITLFCAGTETNTTNICYTLLMLAMHQNIQKKVYEELRAVFGDSDRPPEPSDLSKLVFLEQCIKESLRTTPPPIVLRKAQHDVALSDGRIIPAGSIVTVCIFDINHNPEIYPEPYTWNPHNFDPEKVATRPAYSFIPFGAGPRMCVGYRYAMMAMKIMLSTVLRHYEIKTSCTRTTLEMSVIVKVKEGYNIQLHPRKMTTES